MDVAARMAIEALLVGLVDAEVLSEQQLSKVLQAIEDAAASAGGNMPGVETDLDTMVATIRHISHPSFRRTRRSRS